MTQPIEQRQTKNERIVMNDKFDELAKGIAQSVTRRGALKKFGIGLAGIALACFGLAKRASAAHEPIKGCDHCNVVTNFGCTTQACYWKCYAKCIGGGGG